MNLLPNPAQTIGPRWTHVQSLVDLVAIFEPVTQVCTVSRSVDERIVNYVERLHQYEPFTMIETRTASSELDFDRLPPAPDRDALIADLNLLSEIVRDLVDCPLVGVRVAWIAHAMCPGWHFDKTGLRLVTTYRGPGTEWLDDQSADRGQLEVVQQSDAGYHQAAAGDIVLLKGSLWQGNQAFGAIHRSPDVDPLDGKRLVVTMDPLWED